LEKSIPAAVSSLFRRLASLARKFLVILLSFEQPLTTGEALGGEDFIAFTCLQKELKLALQSAVPSFSLAMCDFERGGATKPIIGSS